MGTFIDLTGKKFGRLTVLERIGKKGREWIWKCKCDCGNFYETAGVNLRRGSTKSCGCLKQETDRTPKGNVIDLIGKKFNHLTVIERAGSDHRGEAKWLCECDCPAHMHIIVLGSNLRTGHTTSCGCERKSRGEQAIIKLLCENNIPFEMEFKPFKFANGHYASFDFYINKKYIIEYDGETHFLANLHGWHTEEQLREQQERDIIKNQWCKDNNIPLIRIPFTHLKELCLEDLLLETSTYII